MLLVHGEPSWSYLYRHIIPPLVAAAGARISLTLVRTSVEDPESGNNIDAWKVLSQFTKPFLTCFSDQDPITRGADKVFQHRVPGAHGQPHRIITGAGHFLQEDKAEELASTIIGFIASTRRTAP